MSCVHGEKGLFCYRCELSSHSDSSFNRLGRASFSTEDIIRITRKDVIRDIRMISVGMDYGAMEAFIMVADTLEKYYGFELKENDNGK